MADDIIWIVTEAEPETLSSDSSETTRGGGVTRNPYERYTYESDRRSTPIQRIPVKAEQLEQGVADFLSVMGRILRQAQQRTEEMTGLTLEEIEVAVEINGEGQLSLLGSGGKVGGKGAMTLRFKVAAIDPS